MRGGNNRRAGSGKAVNLPYILPDLDKVKRISRKRKKQAKKFVTWFYSDDEYNPKRPWPVPSSGAW
jgi:hypothetical protein